MCGVVAALGRVDPSVTEAVAAMSRALAHRGPDGEGFWSDEGVALAHRRLAVLDLGAGAQQPMRDPERGAVISYNGEVYNFRELRARLEARGERFRSTGDTEVVLKAYLAWGEACVERFRGMFAFAIWDPSRRALFLARDRLGIKPLYYGWVDRGAGGRTLLVASELRSLLASGLVARRLAPAALASYAWNGFVNGPDAIVEGVRCLSAGHRALVSPDDLALEERPYWTLPTGSGARSQVGTLAEQLAEAVRLRLVSDVPLGLFLSGGVDSSAVAALASRAASGGIRSFNIGFEESAYDETRYARAVARDLGTEHTTIALSRGDFRAALADAAGSLDQPSFDQLNSYFVSRAVREAGLTVALSGLGGDELFGGYTSFADLPRAARWARRVGRLPLPLRRALETATRRATGAGRGGVGPQVRWAKLADVLATGGRWVELYQTSYALFTGAFYDRLLDGDLTGRAPHGLSAARAAQLARRVAGASPLHAVSLLELSSFVGERLLRDSDAASMAVSLELRVPLLDHRVVEEVSQLDDALRFEPLGRKRLLRRLALEGLDPALFERPKAGFVLPIEEWVRRELREEVARTLGDAERCESVGLRPSAVSDLWQAFARGDRGIYWSRVWALYVLLWWCDRHQLRLA